MTFYVTLFFRAENETRARVASWTRLLSYPTQTLPQGGLGSRVRALHNKKATEKSMAFFGAENETRTRDPDLGKVVLYQLSYFRLSVAFLQMRCKFIVFITKSQIFICFFTNPLRQSLSEGIIFTKISIAQSNLSITRISTFLK